MNAWMYVAVRCRVLQCVAMCCSVFNLLQSGLGHSTRQELWVYLRTYVMQVFTCYECV